MCCVRFPPASHCVCVCVWSPCASLTCGRVQALLWARGFSPRPRPRAGLLSACLSRLYAHVTVPPWVGSPHAHVSGHSPQPLRVRTRRRVVAMCTHVCQSGVSTRVGVHLLSLSLSPSSGDSASDHPRPKASQSVVPSAPRSPADSLPSRRGCEGPLCPPCAFRPSPGKTSALRKGRHPAPNFHTEGRA